MHVKFCKMPGTEIFGSELRISNLIFDKIY